MRVVRVGVDVTAGATDLLGVAGAEPSAGTELTGGEEPLVNAELVVGVELVLGCDLVGEDAFAPDAEPVAVPALRLRPGWAPVDVGVLVTGGASRLPAESGSEDRPMC